MERVLFVTWDGGGNVPPALAIARAIVDDGGLARFIGHEGQRAAIESAGFPFEAYPTARPWSVLRPGPVAPLSYAAVFTDRGLGADVVASLERDPADRVVIDCLLVGALDAAARAGVRYDILVHSLRGVVVRTLTTGPLSLIARLRGLDPARLFRDARREIVTALPSLDEGADSPAVHHVGPVLPPIEGGATPTDPPTVLVSLSTTYIAGQGAVLQRVIDALAAMPARVVVTTGPGVAPDSLRAANNTEAHRYVPHAELMPRASAVVGHGGHSTTMLALAHGVPLLVLPMNPAFDQPTIGRVVAERGAGLTLSRRATGPQIASAVSDLLTTGSYRESAERIGTELAPLHAARDAAALILRD